MTTPAAQSGVDRFSRRGIVLAVWLAVLIVAILFYAGPSWPIVIYLLGTDGTLVALWVLACVGLGEAVFKLARFRSRLDEIPNALHFATSAGVGLGIVSLLT